MRRTPVLAAATRPRTGALPGASRTSSISWGSAALPRRIASLTLVPGLPRSSRMPSNTVMSRVDWPSIDRT